MDQDCKVFVSRNVSRLTHLNNIQYTLCMATNLKLDDDLLNTAVKVSGKKTKKAVVTEALTEYILRRKQLKLLDLFGTIDFDPKYYYKNLRAK